MGIGGRGAGGVAALVVLLLRRLSRVVALSMQDIT
jgi:hypothetical protein